MDSSKKGAGSATRDDMPFFSRGWIVAAAAKPEAAIAGDMATNVLFTQRQALRTPGLWILAFVFFQFSMIQTGITFHFVSVVSSAIRPLYLGIAYDGTCGYAGTLIISAILPPIAAIVALFLGHPAITHKSNAKTVEDAQ